MAEIAPIAQARAALDLLESAAGVSVPALARWDRLSRGLEAMFPGFGARMAAQARKHGLSPWDLERISVPSETTLPYPVAWFAGDAAASPYGVHYTGPRK